MNKDYDDILVRQYPNLYRDRCANMQQTCMCWGFDCSDGWFHIINQLSAKLEAEIMKLPEDERKHCCASQVKQKFGSLRFYLTCSTDKMEKLIYKACEQSAKTCEVCGKRGALRVDGGWYFTACKKHSKGCPRASTPWSRLCRRLSSLIATIKRKFRKDEPF